MSCIMQIRRSDWSRDLSMTMIGQYVTNRPYNYIDFQFAIQWATQTNNWLVMHDYADVLAYLTADRVSIENVR